MNCLAICTASSYKIKSLYDFLKPKATLYKDVIRHSSEASFESKKIPDVFYFHYGVVVFWAVDDKTIQVLLKQLKEFEDQPVEEVERDDFLFQWGSELKIVEDIITLPEGENELTRLAVSHAIAQSVKLGTFENRIRHTFRHTKHIPEDLAKRGKIGLSRKEIRRKMGELFIERNSINLHFDILDTPEFFWDYSDLEPLYMITSNYLDITTRVEVLNYRLTVVRELFEMLGNELNHQHSSRLEWTIIFLIVIEVVLTLVMH